jgi:hypothetical protein
VLPAVAKVVAVPQPIAHLDQHLVQADLLLGDAGLALVHLVLHQVVLGVVTVIPRAATEPVQMAVRPAERDLKDLMHVVEEQIRGEFESAPHRRLTAQQFNAHPIGHRFSATRATSRRRRPANQVDRRPVQASCGRSVTACHRAHLTALVGRGQIDLPQQSGRRTATWMPSPGSGRAMRRSVSDTLSARAIHPGPHATKSAPREQPASADRRRGHQLR